MHDGIGELGAGCFLFLAKDILTEGANFEQYLVSSRDREWCQVVVAESDVFERLTEKLFSESTLNVSLLKVLYNIVYQIESASMRFALVLRGKHPQFSLTVPSEELFLVLKLLFVVSCDPEACRTITGGWIEESLLKMAFEMDLSNIKDDNHAGMGLVHALQIRYNQVNFADLDYHRSCQESMKILEKGEINENTTAITGSIIHIFSAKMSEFDASSLDPELLIQVLLQAINCSSKQNPDYRPLVFLFAKFCCEKSPVLRQQVRKALLPSPARSTGLGPKALQSLFAGTDEKVTLSIGELLFALCKGNVARLIRHVGFGTCAGFLYMKNLLHDQARQEDFESSSDEEYFKLHPQEVQPVLAEIPKTEEEIREFEDLMNRISDFNARAVSQ